MSKTYEDYLNDPRIIHEPMGLRITHAMRFKVQDDIAGMTAEEETAYFHNGAQAAFARLGMTPKYTDPYHENS